ncbi:MAG: PIN domain-containing protein [Deltaproteobacteria bacterium]|nr:PIN domain-containing protein [Deltaproteobacteria bacterium]MBW2365152.1 PIN domain-containing protein [Deltaproteobacteria bacterium]
MKLPQKVYLIDTNVVLRYLLGDHPEFSPKAEAFMTDVSTGKKKAEILDIVIVECVYVMEKFYKIPKTEIVEKLSSLLNFTGIVNPDRSELLEAVLKFKDSNVDIVDCILAACSSPEKVVISFDKDMKKLKAVSETP